MILIHPEDNIFPLIPGHLYGTKNSHNLLAGLTSNDQFSDDYGYKDSPHIFTRWGEGWLIHDRKTGECLAAPLCSKDELRHLAGFDISSEEVFESEAVG